MMMMMNMMIWQWWSLTSLILATRFFVWQFFIDLKKFHRSQVITCVFLPEVCNTNSITPQRPATPTPLLIHSSHPHLVESRFHVLWRFKLEKGSTKKEAVFVVEVYFQRDQLSKWGIYNLIDSLQIIQVFIYLVKTQSRFLGDWIFPPIWNYHPGYVSPCPELHTHSDVLFWRRSSFPNPKSVYITVLCCWV